MTGSTSTSIWKNYSSGVRDYCGHNLREGYVKNVKLDETIFTPTTKDEHDRPISCEEIVSEGKRVVRSEVGAGVKWERERSTSNIRILSSLRSSLKP